jgi:hypothetical protein
MSQRRANNSGLVKEAQRHWQRYLALDPMGDWAAIAREHLAGLPS